MTIVRTFLPLVLVTLLAACGGGGTTTTPNPPTDNPEPGNPAPSEPPPGEPIQEGELTGTWQGTTTLPSLGTVPTTFTLTHEGVAVEGTLTIALTPGSTQTVATGGAAVSDEMTLVAYPANGNIQGVFAYVGSLNGNTLSGVVNAAFAPEYSQESGTFSVTRTAP